MKQGLLAAACGLVLGLIVALVMPVSGEGISTPSSSRDSINFDDDEAHSSTGSTDALTNAGEEGRVGESNGRGDEFLDNAHGLPDREQMFAIVQDLLRRRDSALFYKSETELNALSVPGSPVRAADSELLRELEGVTIVSLHTELRGIDMLDAQNVVDHNEHVTVEVITIQEALEVEGQPVVGPLEERCARWLLAPNPWRLYEVLECGQ